MEKCFTERKKVGKVKDTKEHRPVPRGGDLHPPWQLHSPE
jgi:hypothetical protein